MKKNEKLLREQAQKDLDKIMENDTNFEDHILPKICEFNEKKRQIKNNRMKKYLLIAAPMVFLMICVSVIFGIFSNDSQYSGTFNTRRSDISEVNDHLINTLIDGEFQTIILTYDTKFQKHLFYTLNQEFVSDEACIQSVTELIVDKNYNPVLNDIYSKEMNHLGYTVKMNEEMKSDMMDDVEIFEYAIAAFIDTGQERYIFHYTEITTNNQSSFDDYIQNLISKK